MKWKLEASPEKRKKKKGAEQTRIMSAIALLLKVWSRNV